MLRLGFGVGHVGLHKYVGPCELEEHSPSSWDADLAPFGDRRWLDLAKPSGFARTAKGVNDQAIGMGSIHGSIFRHT